jgi:hypothetical protein
MFNSSILGQSLSISLKSKSVSFEHSESCKLVTSGNFLRMDVMDLEFILREKGDRFLDFQF